MATDSEKPSIGGKQMTVWVRLAKVKRTSTGAPPADPSPWNRIDWNHATDEVARLQRRIAKATQVGRWNKVKSLQRLLTRSYSGKCLAVKRVTENAGKRTAGVDGRIWATPMSRFTAIQSLKHRGYRPLPLRRVFIPKKQNNKK